MINEETKNVEGYNNEGIHNPNTTPEQEPNTNETQETRIKIIDYLPQNFTTLPLQEQKKLFDLYLKASELKRELFERIKKFIESLPYDFEMKLSISKNENEVLIEEIKETQNTEPISRKTKRQILVKKLDTNETYTVRSYAQALNIVVNRYLPNLTFSEKDSAHRILNRYRELLIQNKIEIIEL